MPTVALLGLGHAAGDIHLPACARLPGVKVVAACDPDADRRRALGRRFGIPAVHADATALFSHAKPDIAIIATPPDSHRDLCLLALAHGAHVLCEKPFVRTLAEADEVIAAAERQGRALVVNNEFRYMRTYREPRERLARGEFGRAFLINSWQQIYHPPHRERNWRGGLVQSTLFEFGTHALDLVCFLFDALPVSVSAQMPRPLDGVEADVLVHLTLRFPGERLATLLLNRVSHGLPRYLEMRVDCERASLRLSFGGVARACLGWSRERRRPTMRLSLVRGGEARVEVGGRSRTVARDWTEARPAATARLLEEMLGAVARGRPGCDGARHARELLRIVFAAYESARLGEMVWLRPPEERS